MTHRVEVTTDAGTFTLGPTYSTRRQAYRGLSAFLYNTSSHVLRAQVR